MDFINPGTRETVPQHMTAERDAYYRHLYVAAALSLTLAIVFPLFAPLTEWIVGQLAALHFRAIPSATAYYFYLIFSLDLRQAFHHYFDDFNLLAFQFAPLIKLMIWFIAGALIGFTPSSSTATRRSFSKAAGPTGATTRPSSAWRRAARSASRAGS